MVGDSLGDALKLILGGGGLAGLYALWARVRPELGTISQPLIGRGGARHLFFTIKNRSSFAIRITAIKVQPPMFDVLGGDTLEDAAKAMAGDAVSAFIEPEETKHFPIIGLEGVDAQNRALLCKIRVHWRSLRRENLPHLPATFPTTVQALIDRRENRA